MNNNFRGHFPGDPEPDDEYTELTEAEYIEGTQRGMYYTHALYNAEKVYPDDTDTIDALAMAFMAVVGENVSRAIPDLFADADEDSPLGMAFQVIGEASVKLATCAYLLGGLRHMGPEGVNMLMTLDESILKLLSATRD